MEIKSSLINDKDFVEVKKSLITVSEIDHEENFRVKTLEYINDSSDDNNDMFFFDMLEFTRFLDPNDEAVAYTTPEHLIYLNCPNGGNIGKSVRKWDFVYDHECLHQLWDTFGVAEKLKNEGKKYDHKLLNYASDCVINDYLYFYRKKDRPDNLITPEYIKEQFGVEYDRKVDTQYTLYLKLLDVIEKVKKDPKYQDQPEEGEQQGQSQGGDGQSSSGSGQSQGSKGQSNSNNQDNNKSPEDKAQDSAKEAQDSADKAKEAAGDNEEKKNAAKKAQDHANKAKEEADKAKKAAKEGDKEAAEDHAKKAKEEADKAKEAAKKAGVKDDSKEDQKSDKGGKEQGHSDNEDTPNESEVNIDEIKKKAEELIEKYKKKIAGDFGKFINKCKASQQLRKSGLSTGTVKGAIGWNKQMNSYINAYVKKKVFQKKRELESTYSRVKRGSGYIEYGQPIKPGKKIKENKLTINVAFYIDRSGSMGNCIKQVFDACYVISESLKKQFRKEKVVDEVTFKLYAFNDFMKEIKYGNRTEASGGTMGFDSILNFITKNTDSFMINVIITDAQFSINKNEVKTFMKDIAGMILFITNEESVEMKELSKQYSTQLFYIKADHNFSIDK